MGGTRAGLRAQAVCLVLAGDSPVTLQWLKDDRPLSPNQDGILITQSSDFTSSIAIERTLGEHAGNYSCAASNIAGRTVSSAVLTVTGEHEGVINIKSGTSSVSMSAFILKSTKCSSIILN